MTGTPDPDTKPAAHPDSDPTAPDDEAPSSRLDIIDGQPVLVFAGFGTHRVKLYRLGLPCEHFDRMSVEAFAVQCDRALPGVSRLVQWLRTFSAPPVSLIEFDGDCLALTIAPDFRLALMRVIREVVEQVAYALEMDFPFEEIQIDVATAVELMRTYEGIIAALRPAGNAPAVPAAPLF